MEEEEEWEEEEEEDEEDEEWQFIDDENPMTFFLFFKQFTN